MDHKLLTNREAAEYLRISERTLFEIRKRGGVPFRRLPSGNGGPARVIRYDLRDLQRLADGSGAGCWRPAK
jgi:hypothetical protein